MKSLPQYLFLMFLTLIFISCNSQVKRDVGQKLKSDLEIGNAVDEFDDNIWNIFQDSKDNYWFGSNDEGVYRFDGENLLQFTTHDGLVDNSIRGVQEDSSGLLFIETPIGISTFDGKTFRTLEPTNAISDQWKLKPYDLWFNCNGNDLYRYDGTHLYKLFLPSQDLKKAFGFEVEGVPFRDMNNSPYAVYSIDRDRSGNMWFGTVSAGAYRFDGNSFLWFGEKELSTLPDGRVPGVRSILEDKNGNFWLSNFLSKYKIIEQGSKVSYEKLKAFDESDEMFNGDLPYFNSGLIDDDGNLWMTTYGGGVWFYDGIFLQNFPVKEGRSEVLLVSIYQDNYGNIWLGTHNGGVYKFDGKSFIKFQV